MPMVIGRGFALARFGDITQFLLCAVITGIAVRNAVVQQRAGRLFWALISVGLVAWTVNQGCWVYYEIFLRQEVPEPFVGDVFLFFHIVPFMAALAVRPH